MPENEIHSYPIGSVGASGDEALIERIRTHFSEAALYYTPALIEQLLEPLFDPRSFAANKQRGDFTAQGGSGPRKID